MAPHPDSLGLGLAWTGFRMDLEELANPGPTLAQHPLCPVLGVCGLAEDPEAFCSLASSPAGGRGLEFPQRAPGTQCVGSLQWCKVCLGLGRTLQRHPLETCCEGLSVLPGRRLGLPNTNMALQRFLREPCAPRSWAFPKMQRVLEAERPAECGSGPTLPRPRHLGCRSAVSPFGHHPPDMGWPPLYLLPGVRMSTILSVWMDSVEL